jgi:hypothetical protein
VAVILGIIIDRIISKVRGSVPLDGKNIAAGTTIAEEEAPPPPTV